MGEVDQDLIRRFVADRDEASFATLVERYQSLVFSACLRVLGNRHDAEDAAQAVFLILARKAASIDVNRRLAPWLHRVATDVSRDAWNARRVREHHQRKATTMPRSESDPDLAGELDAAMCQLPERESSAIVWFHLEGRSLEEIAALSQRPVATVGSWLQRGRERLRTVLGRRGVVLSAAALLSGLGGLAASEVPAGFAAATAKATAIFVTSGTASTPVTALAAKCSQAMKLAALVKSGLLTATIIAAMGATGLLAIAAVHAIAPSTNGIDWPAFRGPAANGIASDCRISLDWAANPPREVWRFQLSARPSGTPGVSVANGQVFLIDHDGNRSVVRAISFTDGTQQWETPIDDATGNRERYGFDRATPTVDDGRLFCLTRCGLLVCLDAGTGARIWSVDLVKDFGAIRPEHNFSASPVVDGNALLLMSGPNVDCLLILDKTTGRRLGQAGGPDQGPERERQVSLSTPVIATIGGVKQYVVISDKRFMGIDAATLEVLWRGSYPTPDYSSQPLIIGDAVFYTTGDAVEFSCMLDLSGGKTRKRWTSREIGGWVGSGEVVHNFFTPIYSQGFIYGNDKGGRLVCLDAQTGELKWKSEGDPKRGMQVVGVDGALMVLNSGSGEVSLVRLSPDACTVLGSIAPFTEKGQDYYAPLVVARNHLLVCGPHELVCFALRK